MALLTKLLKNFGWPTLSGLLAAAIILLLFPQLLDKNGTNNDEIATNALSPGDAVSWPRVASYADAVSRAAPSVVNIYTRKRLSTRQHPLLNDLLFRQLFNRSNLPQQQRMQSSLGSGVIISSEGYILTNNHVVSGADEILILLHDGREIAAKIIGGDLETDLAVLKIEEPNLPPINVGNPARARVGDVVLAIGNPFGVGQSVSQGIISATGRNGLGLNTFENFLQTDAAINPGNSGGALVDAYGNLLGINSAILDRKTNSVGVGFATPADTAIKVLEDIIQYGKVIRGWLGVEARSISRDTAQRLGINPPIGLIITNIAAQGPAHKAGLQLNDIVTRVDGKWVGSQTMIQIASLPPGVSIKMEVWRNGEIISVEAVTGTRPTN